MPTNFNLIGLLSGALALVLSACQSAPLPAPQPGPISDAAPAAEYTLSSGDRVRINVFGQTDLSGEFELDGTGTFSMPLIGLIQAEGLAIPELQDRIAQSLSDGYLINPRVSAEVINYRPFYILGEVRNPGEFPYTNGLTVLEAVASAGGFSYRARKSVVYIRGTNATDEVEVPLTATTRVNPGDTLRIRERVF